MTRKPPLFGPLTALLALLLVAVPAHAQADGPPVDESIDLTRPIQEPNPNAVAPEPATELPASTGELQIRVEEFGLGRQPRPGDWAAIRLEIQDNSEKIRTIMVRMNNPDPDGDTAQTTRVITTNPGVKQPLWLYARVPFSTDQSAVYTFTAYEAAEANPGDTRNPVRYEPGRVVGTHAYALPATIPSVYSMIAVVGPRAARVDQYATSRRAQLGWAPTGHEITEVLTGLSLEQIPDQWQGLMAFEALVWTGSGAQFQPSRLNDSQRTAIAEWVRRGGHLVVVLPAVGQTWLGGSGEPSDDPLLSTMPRVRVTRREGADLNPYRAILTRSPEASLPRNAVLHTFEPDPNAGPYEAMPVFNGPDGDTVVVRRLLGEGAVTVVGFDLTGKGIVDSPEAVQASVFWNRVLGKRLELLSPTQLDTLERSANTPGGVQSPWFSNREPVVFDQFVNGEITRQGKVAVGLLLAFVVFAAYWVLAGPGGYFLLKQKGRKQHAWVAFFGAAVVFTGIAWGGANLLKQRRIDGAHLTILDYVYGQTNQRARSWVSLFLPSYGETQVSVRAPAQAGGGPSDWHNLISAWEPPIDVTGGAWSAFPDARGYPVDARFPDTLDVPSRATVKHFQVDWAGGTPQNWPMPQPAHVLDEAGNPIEIGKEIRLVEVAKEGQSAARTWRVEGSLVHKLPGELTDVLVILVRRQTDLRITPNWLSSQGDLIARTHFFKITTPWKPGDPLDLAAVTSQLDRQDYLRQLRGTVPNMQYGLQRDVKVGEGLEAISLFSMLAPPDLGDDRQVVARRQVTHGYDLSRWFTQPCVIVLGHLANSECPVPISVAGIPGEEIRARLTGRTLVRWVYPLSPQPPAVSVLRKELQPGPEPAIPAAPGSPPPAEPEGPQG